MANRWLSHIKKTMKLMKRKGTYKKGLGLKQVIVEAKKHWHKGKRGGAESDSDEEKKTVETPDVPMMNTEGSEGAEGGRRRRRGRKTRRRRHH
jgi:hypothetical protein